MTDKKEIISQHYRELAVKSFEAIKAKHKGKKLSKFYSDKAKKRWAVVDNSKKVA